MSEERKLVKKIAEVMKDVKYIEKKGFNKFHNYKYATESDVAEKVRESLSEKSVVMIPHVKKHSSREHVTGKGKTEYIATVLMEFRLIDGETGEELVFNSIGEGQDAGDKAVYKAITGAQKYALMKAFMIPTGDDPEADNGTDERNNNGNNKQPNSNQSQGNKASDKQLNYVTKLLNDKAKNATQSKEELYAALKERVGTSSEMENWSFSEASKAINILSNKGA